MINIMQEIAENIHTTHKFIDKSLDKSNSEDYHLLIQVGLDNLSITVFDLKRNKFVALQNRSFQDILDYSETVKILNTVFASDDLFQLKYSSVKAAIINKTSTLVPGPLFEQEKAKDYLEYNCTLNNPDKILTDHLKSVDSFNVYSIDHQVERTLRKSFPEIEIVHFSSPLIEGVLLQNKNKTGKKAVIHVQQTHFEILVIDSDKLLLYNSFIYQAKEDFIYYMLFICEQLDLNPEKLPVEIVGEINKQSNLYEILTKYVRNVTFGKRNDSFEYTYEFQDIPLHYYYNLFNIKLCE